MMVIEKLVSQKIQLKKCFKFKTNTEKKIILEKITGHVQKIKYKNCKNSRKIKKKYMGEIVIVNENQRKVYLIKEKALWAIIVMHYQYN